MRRIHPFLICLVALVLGCSGVSAGQLWSGVLNSARATDWSQAGVVGGVPSGSWTQCGPTVAAYSGLATTINNAIAACGSNQYVLLGAGSFNLSTGIDFAHKSNVVLRGSGSNSTSIVFGSSARVNCNGENTLICIWSSDGSYWAPGTGINWTAGYSQGATQVTLSSTAGLTTNSILVLNQCDNGYSGSPCSGASVDNGNFFNCGDAYVASGGCAYNGPDNGNGSPHRFQTELFRVTNISSGTGVVTLASGLKHPNFASARTPQAWFFTPIQNAGVENLSIDSSANGSAQFAVTFFNAVNVWVKGVRVIKPQTAPVGFFDSAHFTAEQNYFYEVQSGDPFGIHLTVTADGLVQNNIFQQIAIPILMDGDDVGTVFAYNFTINNCNYLSSSQTCASDGMQQSFRPHSNGDDFQLYEGNVGTNYDADGDHGSHLSQTMYRNLFTGWESCGVSNGMGGNGPCGSTTSKDYLTNAMLLSAYQGRYHNMVANVLGTPGYHSTYQYTSSLDNHGIYGIGTGVGGNVPYDSIVGSTFMRWGNYDVVTNAVRWCGNSSDTGWGTACGGTSEIPTGLSVYPNSVPTLGDTQAGQGALPASFYLSSKPAWFGSHAWPAIGPDVSGGNVLQCNGTLNATNKYNGVAVSNSSQCAGSGASSAWGGHVNLVPAMDCFLNTMGGAPDGTGSVLAFDSGSCYPSSNSSSDTPMPPTNLLVNVQ